MSTKRRVTPALRATLLLCTLLAAAASSPSAEPRANRSGVPVEPQQPTTAPTTTPPQTEPTAPAGRGGRGGQGGGGLPPMNPIDESAPPPPLVTPGKLFGEPPSDAVV